MGTGHPDPVAREQSELVGRAPAELDPTSPVSDQLQIHPHFEPEVGDPLHRGCPPAKVVVAVDDRPYYARGPYYIEHGRRWVWVNGHWGRRHGHRVWIHGRYLVRG